MSGEQRKGSLKNGECQHPGLQSSNLSAGRYTSVNYDNFTQEGKFLYRDELSRRIQDKSYIWQLQTDFMTWSYRFERLSQSMDITCLMLDDRLHCLSQFTPSARHRFIKLIGCTLKNQQRVECLTAEFGDLAQDDGIKFILSVALGGGQHLKTLHLWRLFKPGRLPVSDIPSRQISDNFPPGEVLHSPSQRDIECLWERFVLREAPYLAPEERVYLLYASLRTLTNLTVLSMDYSYFVGGQGIALCQLSCAMNTKTLKILNLLFTESDDPAKTKRIISEEIWRFVTERNPNLRVNIVAIRMADYNSLHLILTRYLPLEKIYASSGFGSESLKEGVRLDLTTRVMIEHYPDFLKSVTLHIQSAEFAVDLCLGKFLTKFPLLEEFEFRGTIDRLHVMPYLLDGVLSNKGCIQKLHFYLPLSETCPERVEELYSQYKDLFILEDIDFELKSICI